MSQFAGYSPRKLKAPDRIAFALLAAALLFAAHSRSTGADTASNKDKTMNDMKHEGMNTGAAPATADAPTSATTAQAVFAGGCFWCVEGVFEQLDGVIDAESGYSGGEASTANYEAVCTGQTGHAEAVRITYDPKKISYEKLLEVHFATHDPTTLNRQGNDAGTQYRSTIFYANTAQKIAAQDYIGHLNETKKFQGRKIVTTLEPLKKFYPAELYHQNYVCNNPMQPYIQAVAMPKVEKTRDLFHDLLKPQPKP